jgi:hypothetical protein
MSKSRIPPTEEIVSRQELVRRHPTILTKASVQWALRKRATNGLWRAVYEARNGALLIHEPTFINWFLEPKGHHELRARRVRVGDALPEASSCPARAGGDAPRRGNHPVHGGNVASSRDREVEQSVCGVSRRHSPNSPTVPIYIQFISDTSLYGLEKDKATRLLKIIKATHQDDDVKANADLLLKAIKRGREVFDEHPLISEFGRGQQSPTIYIHDVIWNEIANAIKAARAIGGCDG